jgi:hypothetical protein
MIDEQLKGQKGEYSVQIDEISEGELSIRVGYKDPLRTREYAAYFYTDFERRWPNQKIKHVCYEEVSDD